MDASNEEAEESVYQALKAGMRDCMSLVQPSANQHKMGKCDAHNG